MVWMSQITKEAADDVALFVDEEAILKQIVDVCRIPSPTFSEEQRARYIKARLEEMDLRAVHMDEIFNVSAMLPGTGGGGRPLMIVAHIDTVFPTGTDVEPRWDGRYWRAPGIRDNSASVAITLLLPQILRSNGLKLKRDLILGFSVGEEGLGNLRGVKALMQRYGSCLSGVVAADGDIGVISHRGVAVRRLKVTATAEGGHSWADAGKPSAVHHLVGVAAELSRIMLPSTPKTALNIGTFQGGTSVNAIAQSAQFLLDLRSVDQATLDHIENEVRLVLEKRRPGVEVATAVVGQRPGGSIADDHPLVASILDGYRQVGVEGRLMASSTDANIPLSLGIPAASMGISAGGGIHTLDEYLDPATPPLGARALVLALLALEQNLP